MAIAQLIESDFCTPLLKQSGCAVFVAINHGKPHSVPVKFKTIFVVGDRRRRSKSFGNHNTPLSNN